ncbi:MAG: hypothetical protein A2X86_04965 [Bdellovibrionales bacterium GWA2_49_15]|nr:MAG: hypothetical protein A2X86_04965 [Bdellovibrionales bacterium GWA2_49_15]
MQSVNLLPFKNKKVALVLSGGVVKAAAWHLGVSLALEELGFAFKHNNSDPKADFEIGTYVGSSAGALVSLFFACGIRPIDVIQASVDPRNARIRPITYKDMLCLGHPRKRPPRPLIFDPFEDFPYFVRKVLSPFLSISGIFSTKGLYKYITENVLVASDFCDYKADLFVVATQLDHSRKVIFSKYNYPSPLHDSTAHYYTGIPVADSVCASMSVPPFYVPYPIVNNHTSQVDYYIDGEIRETLSTHVSIDNGCEFIISSWTHTPYHYQDEIGSLVNYGLPAICVQSIYLLIQKKIVESRARRATAKDILDTVYDFMHGNQFSKSDTNKLLSILERKLNYSPKVKLIDIYPTNENFKLFFTNSFSLNAEKMSYIVKMGYKRTLEVFKEFEC